MNVFQMPSELDPLTGVRLTETTEQPAPTPMPGPDEPLVTPGPWGFILTMSVAVATIALVQDMTRRIRRTRYRSEVRERLAAEQAPADAPGQRSWAAEPPSANAGETS